MSPSDPLGPADPGRPAESAADTNAGASTGFTDSPGFAAGDEAPPTLPGEFASDGDMGADVTAPQAETPSPAGPHTPPAPHKDGLKLTPRRDWILLRVVIAIVGLAIVASGVWGAIAGTAGIWGIGAVRMIASNPTLENDHAFLSAVLAGVGLAFLWVAFALDHAGAFLAALCGIVFLGAIARVLSWAITGTPHWSQIVLMICQLVIPPLLLLWHGWIRRTQKLKASFLAQR